MNYNSQKAKLMIWTKITTLNQLNDIDTESQSEKIMIFKHSTTCSISRMALNRLESKWKPEYSETLKPYFLDLLAYRNISNEIARRYDVVHESPQVLVVSKGKSIYNESHGGITVDEILTVNI
ncbi:MAG TPA: bacillithiol system redox-active protein YtxJ [Bacteroidia bacterium]|nr:bacillithiol system redox-active protein YtxJ [Bacteroidia bacterium]